MEEKKKRRGYKTSKQQAEATKRYLENNPEAKEKKKIATYKSRAKVFIRDYANLKELSEMSELIEKSKEEMKMKKWGEIKNLIKREDYVVSEDLIDKSTGECTVDIISGKYAGFSVAAKVVFGQDEDEIIIDDSAEVYNPAE